jgi:uncharacterized protein YbjT (DUF2867 family)
VNTILPAPRREGVRQYVADGGRAVEHCRTSPSAQHKVHWLAEKALNWSGLPVVHVRPMVLLAGFSLVFTPDSVRESNQIRRPLSVQEFVGKHVATFTASAIDR